MTKKDKLFQHLMYRYEKEGSFLVSIDDLNNIAGFDTQDRDDRNVKAIGGLSATMSKFRKDGIVDSYFDKELNGYVVQDVSDMWTHKFKLKHRDNPNIIHDVEYGRKFITLAELSRLLSVNSFTISKLIKDHLILGSETYFISLFTKYGLKRTQVFSVYEALMICESLNTPKSPDLIKALKKEIEND